MVNWTAISTLFSAIGSCSTALSIIILIVTLFYLHREVREIRISTYSSAYKAVVEILQADEIRSARKYLFENLENKSFDIWSKQDIKEAEKVCHTYDSVGQMVRYGFIPKHYIVDSWGASLRRSWSIISPLVHEYRQQNNAMEIWDDLEWLAREAKHFQKAITKNTP